MDLSTVLQNTLSPDQSIRHHAGRMLEEAARCNGLANYMSTLIQLLSADAETVVVRIAAGLAAKNALINRRDAAKQADMAQRWLDLAEPQRQPIRTAGLHALAAQSPAVGTTAAQVVASIATIELPVGQWDDLLLFLVRNVTDAQVAVNLKRASVEAIGFICEESDRIGPVLEKHSSPILTAVIHGMQSGELSVRIASCKAFLNSLEFASSAFLHPQERAFIMRTICEIAAQHEAHEDLAVIAFQCLVRIVNLYYSSLLEYMNGGLEQLVIGAMQTSDSESIQLQAIEFWSTICEVEVDLVEQLEDAPSAGDPAPANFRFAQSALPRLLPAILALLMKQSDDYGEASGSSDDWTPAMAAATCLSLLAAAVGDAVVADGTLLSFVQANIQDASDWRKREAAAMAFGSVLDGPDPKKMSGLVRTALPHFVSLLSDQSVAVRDTTAWCIGEACRGFVDVIPPAQLHGLIEALVRGLQDRPRVSANCSWAAAHLAQQLSESSMLDATFFVHIMQALLQAAMRPDAGEANLRTCAFQALASVVSNAPVAAVPMVDQLANYLVAQLESSMSSGPQLASPDDRTKFQEVHGNYAAVLQSAVKVLDVDQVVLFSDRLVSVILTQLAPLISNAASRPPTPASIPEAESGAGSTGSAAAFWEDLLLLLGTIVGRVGDRIAKHIDGITAVLAAALSGAYHLETSLCIIAIIDIGETAQSLKDKFAPLAPPFLQLLASVLSSSSIAQSVKPKAISAVGDIALAVGPAFGFSFATILPILLQAAQVVSQSPPDLDDWEQVDFLVEMRLSLVEAFTCIVQGAADDRDTLQALSPTIPLILAFLKSIIAVPKAEYDAMIDDSLVKATIGLVGDIAAAFLGNPVACASLKDPWIATFLSTQGKRRNVPDSVASVLRWTLSQVARVP